MKRRSRTGGESTKGRRGKTPVPKRRDALKTTAPLDASSALEETKVARLTHELKEAFEQQSATSEVFRVISSYPGDPQPVFQAMLKNAVRLCDAEFGNIYRWDGDTLHLVATQNAPPSFAEARRVTSGRSGPKTPTGRMIANKKVVHIADLRAEKAYADRDPWIVTGVELGGVRTVLMVPMLKENKLIGAFSVYRQKVQPFSDKQIELSKNFAAQAVIAIENARLLSELRQRTDDLSQRTTDLAKALEQQTATSDVLQVISSSPGDLHPVFATMLEKAVLMCEAKFGTLNLAEGGKLRLVAAQQAPEFIKARTAAFEPAPGGAFDETMKTKRIVHVPDLAATKLYAEREPTAVAAVELGGVRTALVVPMLKDDKVIGVMTIVRQEVRPFTDKQIELVKNFAAQAVIAIENARLLNELQQRTSELTESLERQTATSDVLQVVSSSLGDLKPVFEAMLQNATRICAGRFGILWLYEGGDFRCAALHNAPAAVAEQFQRQPVVHPAPGAGLSTLAETRQVTHVADMAATQTYIEQRAPAVVAAVELGGVRTFVHVPMLKENNLIGAITVFRQEVRPFGEKQIELLKNFAAQAVIAIENARLLNELRQRTTDLTEALEQQTATSEVLQIISGSPGDLQPVFAAMLENAARICDANFGNIFRWDGEALWLVATHNTPPAFTEHRRRVPFRPNQGNPIGEMLKANAAIHVADLARDERYIQKSDPEVVAAVELGGIRTFVAVAMLKDEKLIGAVILYRQEVRPFSDKQIELVKNFAAQAVIAIENARLLNELRQRTSDLTESLEQQTATSEVLKVISSSPGDLEPVFTTMLENAARICDANFGHVYLWDGDLLRLVAAHNTPPAFAESRKSAPFRPKPSHPFSRIVVSKQVFHVPDVAALPAYRERDPQIVEAVELGGIRTCLGVPMLKENNLIGALLVYRQEVRPFTDRQLALLQSFAAQAVIAMENARLLKELRERTEQVEAQSQELVKLNQNLEQRVADQVGEIERMGRLRRFLPPQVADLIVATGSDKQLESHRREITALFCDLRGFTGFTESADAEDVITLLREYHAAVGEKIIKYSGTLERYAGDGVMVVFNDPVPVENPALQAVLMALEMRDAIGVLTGKWRRFGHDIGFGIGIAHGYATLGTIGFEGRFDYAAIGTVSNVASRLCDEAKPGQILINPRVLVAVEDAVKVEPVGEFELKGIRRPLAAYNVVGALQE